MLIHHLQNSIAVFALGAVDEHDQMWRHRARHRLRGNLRKEHPGEVNACRWSFYLAHRKVVYEECCNDVHERRTLPLSTVTRRRTLSEDESKQLLGPLGARFAREAVVHDVASAVAAAEQIGFPVVAKLVGDRLAHKSERGLVRLSLNSADAVREACELLLSLRRADDGDVRLLIAEQVVGNRELIVGMVRDPQFGATVLIGAGGIAAEVLADSQARPLPLRDHDLDDMLNSLVSAGLFADFRGQQALDRHALARTVQAVTTLAAQRPDVASIDLNPVIVTPQGEPIAVDALVELGGGELSSDVDANFAPRHSDRNLRSLFDPRGVVIVGASTHPGKFGFVALHNLLAAKYGGRVAATNLSGETVLGVQCVETIDDLPTDHFDLAVLCTPASANEDILRACARRGIAAAFVTSAGYGEADEAGQTAQTRLVALGAELGMLIAGPNGQGVVSTPSSLCAQIVAPYPPPGGISIASQSGNFVSSFMNLARASGVGVARAVSAGNAAAVDVADYLEWFSRDDATRVMLSYIESVVDGVRLQQALTAANLRKPVVVVKGGATESGARAAASHTGALASNDRVFDGLCRQLGVVRARDIDEAFDAAAFFATSPLPRGNRTAILTTAGGWGVVTSDALARDGVLQLATLSSETMASLDALLPARWSRNNPVDCAGGETRDTIPAVLEVLATAPEVDAVVYLGIGIQSNQARLMREGGFYPDHGLERIVEYHERQDRRFAQSAVEMASRTNKPVLIATELAVADATGAAPSAVRELEAMCFASGPRAVRALAHAYGWARTHELLRAK